VAIINAQALWGKKAVASGEQMTLALLPCDEQYNYLRLTCCDRDKGASLTRILQALDGSPLVWADGTHYEVASCTLDHPTWADFLTQRAGTHICFHFATPVVTALPMKDEAMTAWPFPEPVVLFSHVFHQWQSLRGPMFGSESDELIQAAGCVVSNGHIHTTEIETADRLLLGYRGWIEYTCRGKEQRAIASLCALARFAFFTGLGYLRAEGMGTTRVTITK
jgi:hypothetical protein